MNSTADDIAARLVLLGVGALGGTADWSVNVNAEPDKPDNCVTVYDTGGPGQDDDDLDEWVNTFQVRVRAKAQRAGAQVHETIRDGLLPSSFDAGTSTFILVAMTSDILTIGRDESQRFLMVANYRSRRKLKET